MPSFHYCTMHQTKPYSNELSYNDGIITCELPIDSPIRHDEVRQAIANHIGRDADKFILLSLTLLNP